MIQSAAVLQGLVGVVRPGNGDVVSGADMTPMLLEHLRCHGEKEANMLRASRVSLRSVRSL